MVMDDVTNIALVGFPEKDVRVMSTIVKISPVLKGGFELLEGDGPSGADIYFVNSDDANAMRQADTLRQANAFSSFIMVYSDKAPRDHAYTMPRPIVLKRVQEALEQVVSVGSNNTTKNEDSADTNEGPLLKVLVVDDSFPVRKYMEGKLPLISKQPLDLEFAASGNEAMHKVKGRPYDLVFLDVVMDDVDGYKVCKWIKSTRPNTKVVMLTSKTSQFDKVRGSMSGCDDYLTKPPEEDALKKALAWNS